MMRRAGLSLSNALVINKSDMVVTSNLTTAVTIYLCPQEHGDYKICFDNTFSYLSSKTVYFEILNENEDEDYDELRDIFGDDEEVDAEYYEVSVAEIEVGCS